VSQAGYGPARYNVSKSTATRLVTSYFATSSWTTS